MRKLIALQSIKAYIQTWLCTMSCQISPKAFWALNKQNNSKPKKNEAIEAKSSVMLDSLSLVRFLFHSKPSLIFSIQNLYLSSLQFKPSLICCISAPWRKIMSALRRAGLTKTSCKSFAIELQKRPHCKTLHTTLVYEIFGFKSPWNFGKSRSFGCNFNRSMRNTL